MRNVQFLRIVRFGDALIQPPLTHSNAQSDTSFFTCASFNGERTEAAFKTHLGKYVSVLKMMCTFVLVIFNQFHSEYKQLDGPTFRCILDRRTIV